MTVKHNGWLYYAGGDQLWHYSGAYLLAHGHLPPAFVGYGWSMHAAAALVVRRTEPRLRAAGDRPAATRVVLLPVALLCVYGIASAHRRAPRSGTSPPLLWIVLPYLGILFVEPGYHQKYTELTLPQRPRADLGAGLPGNGRAPRSARTSACARSTRPGGTPVAAAGLAAG